jgi:membrane-associated protease RseP (regulator of RpoE activity)
MRLLLPLICAAAMVAGESDYQQFDQDPMLGVNMTPPSAASQAANGINPDTGVEAQSVYPGTAAESMGITSGDVITSINGSPISSMNDLRNEVSLIGVGGTATVEVLRNGQKVSMTNTIGAWPKNIPREPIDAAAERRFRDWQARRLDRTQQAVTNLRKQVEDIERRANSERQAHQGLSPVQAMQLPASEALELMPAFHVTVHLAHDALNASEAEPGTPNRDVSWDARVLIGTPAATIL